MHQSSREHYLVHPFNVANVPTWRSQIGVLNVDGYMAEPGRDLGAAGDRSTGRPQTGGSRPLGHYLAPSCLLPC